MRSPQPGRATGDGSELGIMGRLGHGGTGHCGRSCGILDRRLVQTTTETVHSASLSCEKDWLLSDHRFKNGPALIPGTGYLQLAAAALVKDRFEPGVSFEDVFFLRLLPLLQIETREVRVRLRRQGSGFRFSIWPKTRDGANTHPDKLHATRNAFPEIRMWRKSRGTLTTRFCGVANDNFCVSPEGNISACHEVADERQPWAERFFYGRPSAAASGFDFDERAYSALRAHTVDRLEYCNGCFAKWNCAGDCHHKALHWDSAEFAARVDARSAAH